MAGHKTTSPKDKSDQVGAGAWGWEPWGLPLAAGMAIHLMDRPGTRWCLDTPAAQEEDERRYPNNSFVQNAHLADQLILLHRLAHAFLCHDRPERFVLSSGCYGRPDGGSVQPHALWAVASG